MNVRSKTVMNNPAAKYQRSDTTHRGLLTHQRENPAPAHHETPAR